MLVLSGVASTRLTANICTSLALPYSKIDYN